MISAKLKSIDRLQRKLGLSAPNENWDAEFMEKVKIDFTYSSNKIEGGRASYGQTIQLLKNFVTPKNLTAGDCLDIVNHKKVLDIVFDEYRAAEITEANIKKLHKELMKSPAQWADDVHYDPGKYKIVENLTTRPGGRIHVYTQPEDVPIAMRW